MTTLLRNLKRHFNEATNGAVVITMAVVAVLTLIGASHNVNTKLDSYKDYHDDELADMLEYVRHLEWYIMTSPNGN